MIIPSHEHRQTKHHAPRKLPKGPDALVDAWIGRYQRRGRVLQSLQEDAERVDGFASEFQQLTDHKLQERLADFRERFRRRARNAEAGLWPALAAVREAADRRVGLRAFRVQLIGALALYRGNLAEMATGEGKTLTAGLVAVLFGWTRLPCHIVTVNDYLVQRDAEWLGPLFRFCGIQVGYVTAAMPPEARQTAYQCDVTYATSKELVADFLRDRIELGVIRDPVRQLIRRIAQPTRTRDGLVMRGLHTAIVDEADSLLIDEAVTPLIISTLRKNEPLRDVVQTAHEIAEEFEPDEDYEIDPRYREVELTSRGTRKMEERCGALPGLWRGNLRRLEFIRQALQAREFYRAGKQYVVSDDKVVIVDEFTGRPMPQRSWRQGMHQAIEAKEGIAISDPAETIARLSFQRFFRLFERLSGMTGTAREVASELWQIYRLPVVSIPTNRPCIRKEKADCVFADQELKWQTVVEETLQMHATGRPVLIGTRSVAASEDLSRRLAARRVEFRLLNAVRHLEEAQIIAEAGRFGRITIATNMAGRGTDIKLERGVPELGGLHVIATERHESRRVDRQLFGRSARQGDPGSAQAFVSLEDELVRRYLPKMVVRRLSGILRASQPGAQPAARAAIGLAQGIAQREAFRQRRNVLKTDTWMDEALSFAGPEAV